MQYFLKKSLAIFFCLVTLGFQHATLHAYVLPGPYLLKLMTQNLGIADRLLVTQKLVLHDDNPSMSADELSETLKFKFPKTFRSDIVSENIQRIRIVSDSSVFTVIDGKISDEPENSYDHYKDLILFRSREILQERLSNLGVDVKVTSLGRFQGKPAYVLGAQYPDETSPQVWLDKETFLPFRWIMTSNATQNLEVLYLDWKKLNQTWYPMRIEFFSNGNLVREIHVQDIEVNPSFQADLFDIQQLKSLYPQDAPAESKNVGKEEPDEVQKTIEEFKKIYK
ncbi:MAG: outer membrane lipoprotein-sorting protein [Proteobacteria bacterium]|nr:outer membrane lipoprotein-sorting protein [Pseudomonadota bacterium]